jgi:membrane protein required for colicin V production
MMFFNWFVQPDQQPEWVLDAKSRPILLSIGERLVAVLPEDPEKAILDRIRDANLPGSSAGAQSEEPEYSESERQGLDQLTSDNN